jgi:hypothetical protein
MFRRGYGLVGASNRLAPTPWYFLPPDLSSRLGEAGLNPWARTWREMAAWRLRGRRSSTLFEFSFP